MPTEHGLLSDLKYYSKKKRLHLYLKGEVKRYYYANKTKWSFLFDDYVLGTFDPFRVLAKKFEKELPRLQQHHVKVGNYYLDSSIKYSKPPIIYSLGVLTDVTFDVAAAQYFNTAVFLFDPAPVAIDYMAKQSNSQLKFFDFGVWVENKEMEFMVPKGYGRSPSMFIEHDGGKFTATCKSIPTILAELGHQKIDILKMDIEGAALPILENFLELGIELPSQIVVEFENVNPTLQQFCDFYTRVINLIDRLNREGYEVVNLPREYNFYRSVELLFSRVAR